MTDTLRHNAIPSRDASASRDAFERLEQAAHWFAILTDDEVSEQDQQRWQQWLQASPANQQAWSKIQRVSRRFESLREDSDRLAVSTVLQGSSQRQLHRRRLLSGLAGVMGVSLCSWLSWRVTPLPQWVAHWSADISTAVGEVASHRLQDGTQLWLGSSSAANVLFDQQQRRLQLLSGDVLIETSHQLDPRLFVVSTAQVRLRPLGTRFSVRAEQGRTTLAVFAGAVECSGLDGRVLAVVRTGQQISLSDAGASAISAAAPYQQSWAAGVLQADDMPLAQLLEELGRYHRVHLGVDPALANLRVMGTFPLDDLPLVLSMLSQSLPLTVSQPLPWWVSLRPAVTL